MGRPAASPRLRLRIQHQGQRPREASSQAELRLSREGPNEARRFPPLESRRRARLGPPALPKAPLGSFPAHGVVGQTALDPALLKRLSGGPAASAKLLQSGRGAWRAGTPPTSSGLRAGRLAQDQGSSQSSPWALLEKMRGISWGAATLMGRRQGARGEGAGKGTPGLGLCKGPPPKPSAPGAPLRREGEGALVPEVAS